MSKINLTEEELNHFEFKLHETSGGTFRILVNGEVSPLLVGFETASDAIGRFTELYPSATVIRLHNRNDGLLKVYTWTGKTIKPESEIQ